MPVRTQQELDNLLKLFRNARDQLLDTIINYHGVGTKTYANTILKQVEAQLEALEKATGRYAGSVIPAEYQKALEETYEYFKKNKLLMKSPEHFAALHNDAIYQIAREMQYQIGQGLEQVGRQILRYVESARDNALRAAGLEATGEKIASGSTVRQMKENLIKKLREEGFMTVQYGQGKYAYQVSLDSYAAMVARSTTREAGNIARENQLTANGYDLVKMTTHYPTCHICAQFQGRVYSITGKDRRFPPLSRAFASGYHNVHPNCRHSVHPWIEDLHEPDEIQQAIAESNRPFKDDRDQKQIELYNKQQNQNREMRQDRFQHERYKARLGEYAPTFSVFRRIKKENGRAWGVLQAQYKGMGYYEKAVRNEPKITQVVIDTAKEVGADVVGLENRIKSKESFLRKIDINYDPSGNEYEVKDILRYTYTADVAEYTSKTLNSIEVFENKGYNTITVKNYWLDTTNPYKGINTVISAPNGQKFEMQYHTPESFDLKNGKLHKLYEEWRALPKESEKRIDLENRMKKLSDSLAPPLDVERVN